MHIIRPNVRLEDDVVIKAHVVLDGHTNSRAGNNQFYEPGVSARKTQDLKFPQRNGHVEIGGRVRDP